MKIHLTRVLCKLSRQSVDYSVVRVRLAKQRKGVRKKKNFENYFRRVRFGEMTMQ